MNFSKHISHLSFFAVCALLALVAVPFNARWPRQVQARPAAAWQGEAAIQQLKAEGGYASLAAAMTAARAQADAASGQSGALITQQRKLTAADGAASDQFGTAVALSGDTAVIGAPFDDVVGVNQGSAYVFVRSGAGWTLQQKLVAPNNAAGELFGRAVAIDGDTVVVGAPTHNNGPRAAEGYAIVFVRNAGVWTGQVTLTPIDGAAEDFFGSSVAISGDTAVVGAPNHANGTNAGQGAAYVIIRTNGQWAHQQTLIANDGATGDNFGAAVAASGDTVAVGANSDDFGASANQGSAYVFSRGGTVWTQQQKLTASDGGADDFFGLSIALGGDTVVVGAPFNLIGANPSQGAAYVFTRNGTRWTQQQQLTASDGAAGDAFGFSVSLSGDLVAVGAFGKSLDENANQGAAYVFNRNGGAWTQQRRLLSDEGAAQDRFGFAVALSGDTMLAGVPFDDSSVNRDQGSAYVFASPACPTVTLNPASLPGGIVGAAYSQTVTASSAGGGAEPFQLAFSGGTLPPGLTLAQSGLLSGTPTLAGAFSFTLTATALNSLCPGSRAYTLTVGSGNCNFTVTPLNQTFLSDGGNGTVNVTAGNDCAWTAVSEAPGIVITSGQRGSGNGAVRFTVEKNLTSTSLRGTLIIAGQRVTVQQAAPLACVSAASFTGNTLAAESIVAAFGSALTNDTQAATTQPLPTALAGARLSVRDSLGVERFAPLFFVSPKQVNFQVPPGTAAGTAQVTVLRDGEPVAASSQRIEPVAPGLFAANANGQGALTGLALRVKADGSQSFEPVTRFDEGQRRFVATPIEFGPATDRLFLILFGTGLRNRSALGAVNVKLGNVNVDVLFAGAQGSFIGLDQLNVALPRNLAGRGEVDVNLTVDGAAANSLKVAIR